MNQNLTLHLSAHGGGLYLLLNAPPLSDSYLFGANAEEAVAWGPLGTIARSSLLRFGTDVVIFLDASDAQMAEPMN